MARPTLAEAGKVIIKMAPSGLSNKQFVIARRSNPAGVIPAHLKGYTDKFSAAAPKCAAQIRGMPKGAAKVLAMRSCMSRELS